MDTIRVVAEPLLGFGLGTRQALVRVNWIDVAETICHVGADPAGVMPANE